MHLIKRDIVRRWKLTRPVISLAISWGNITSSPGAFSGYSFRVQSYCPPSVIQRSFFSSIFSTDKGL